MKTSLRWLSPSLIALLVLAVPVLLLGGGKVEAGKAVFNKKCATCHAMTGEGNPAIAKMLKVELRDLGSKEVQAQSDDELKKFITKGTEKKKPVKGLSEDDLANVLACLRSLAKK